MVLVITESLNLSVVDLDLAETFYAQINCCVEYEYKFSISFLV